MIKNFVLSPKTRVIFGTDAIEQVGKNVAQYGKRCLVHYDGGPHLDKLLERVRVLLKDEGVEVFELGGVLPNPRYSLVEEGIAIARKQNIDFVLGVGGGSVMDSAKLIAFGVHADFDIWEYRPYTPISHKIVPHGTISTLPGTGSELSAAAMVLEDRGEKAEKRLFGNAEMRFDFAIINPELAYTLPWRQTAAGSFDIMSHSMEGYFTTTENSYLLDGYLETVIKTVMANVRIAKSEPDNYDARANLWVASLMPMEHYVILSTQPDWVVHNIEKPLTSIHGKVHGEMLGILTLAWMKFVYKRNVKQFFKWGVNCMGAIPDYHNPELTVLDGIERLRQWLIYSGMPTTLSEVGIDEGAFEEAALQALKVAGFKGREGTIGMNSKLTYDEIIAVYRLAL